MSNRFEPKVKPVINYDRPSL